MTITQNHFGIVSSRSSFVIVHSLYHKYVEHDIFLYNKSSDSTSVSHDVLYFTTSSAKVSNVTIILGIDENDPSKVYLASIFFDLGGKTQETRNAIALIPSCISFHSLNYIDENISDNDEQSLLERIYNYVKNTK